MITTVVAPAQGSNGTSAQGIGAAVVATGEVARGQPEKYQSSIRPSATDHHIHHGPKVTNSVGGHASNSSLPTSGGLPVVQSARLVARS